jgi:hypothetical protein
MESQVTDFITNVSDVVHWFNIKVLDQKRQKVDFLSWSGLKWELRLKYNWYFNYRAALLQVKYPKFQVQTTWGNEPATGKTLEEIRKSKISSKKATITKAKNNLAGYLAEFEHYKKSYIEIFPIEDQLKYKEFLQNIALLKDKVNRLEFELRTLENNL